MEVRVVTLTDLELKKLVEDATAAGYHRAAEEREVRMAEIATALDRPMMKRVLTVREAAEYARRDPATVRRWIKDGLPAGRREGAGYRINREDLETWLRGTQPQGAT